jgi:threonine dehydrogenase-like Zn-dependent dehydrogenase
MFAVGLNFETRALEEGRLPDPGEPGRGEVLLRILEVGICATDRELLKFHYGEPPPGERFLALGHEALAVVEFTGPGAEGFEPGDLVVPMIRRACAPACRSCASGRLDLCETGRYLERGILRRHGYFTERAVDAAGSLVRVPPELAGVAVLAEPLSVVEKALEAAWRNVFHPPRSALVIGAGPVGLLLCLGLRARGVEHVFIHSLEPAGHPRALLAIGAGARYLAPEMAVPRCDLVFEASGSEEGGELALESIAPLGILILVGAADFPASFPGIRLVLQNQAILGVVNAARHHFEVALADLARFDRTILDRMVTRLDRRSWVESLTGPGRGLKFVHRME